MTNELLQGFAQAKKITKKFAKTFYLSSLFLPKDKQNASYAVYAICRLSDESVDQLNDFQQQNQLSQIEQDIASAYTQKPLNNPLLAAFRQTVNNYNIPKEYFDELINGMRMDLEIRRYPNFLALKDYCYKVAGVVGLIMLKIFGYKDASAYDYAIKLGIAMQLTNILRDIKEDFARGRIYLPQNEMQQFNISEFQLANQENDQNFKNFINFQIKRCEELYAQSQNGINLIDNRFCRFVVLTMKEIYAEILNVIKKNSYDVFSRRAHVGKFKKLSIVISILLRGKYR
ncbi:MAG: phytoene/squalene synthase family protein [Candidatus Omnitrophota bacterium]